MKPYDVEQAKADVEAKAKDATAMARQMIEEERVAAIKRLEVQAATFAEMPKGVADLMRGASHVWIEEIVGDGGIVAGVEFQNVWIIHTNGARTNLGRYDKRIDLPNKKHRMIAFFVPME